MAKDVEVAEAPAPKNKKMLVIIIIVVVLVIAIGGAAAFLLMGGNKHGKGKEGEPAETAEKHSKPVVVAFEEKFTVNLRSEDGGNHFMQVPKMELEVASDEVAKKIEESKSKVSDRISSTLRSKSMKEMLEPGSDIKLKDELRTVINEALEIRDSKKGVKEVILPASFIVQ
jgi:flagellar FliL protein